MANKKKKHKKIAEYCENYYGYAIPMDEKTCNNSPLIMNILQKMYDENHTPTADIPQEMPYHEQNDFMGQKIQQSEQFKQYNAQFEPFIQGTVNALYDNYITSDEHRAKLYNLKKNCKSDRNSIKNLSHELDAEKEYSQKLMNQISKLQKQHQKTAIHLDRAEKILVYISYYMGICNKNTSTKDLVLDWKYYNKNYKPQSKR